MSQVLANKLSDTPHLTFGCNANYWNSHLGQITLQVVTQEITLLL